MWDPFLTIIKYYRNDNFTVKSKESRKEKRKNIDATRHIDQGVDIHLDER